MHVAHTQREICVSVSMHVCLHCEWCVNMYICMVYLLQADMVETETCNNGSKTAECTAVGCVRRNKGRLPVRYTISL